MSIYASTVSFDADDHQPGCARLVPTTSDDPVPTYVIVTNTGTWTIDNTQPCTCHAGPLRYQQSHVLPSDDDERAGRFDLAEIPGFISRGDRILCDEATCDKPATACCDRVWPWLRVGINSETVVLDRDQVKRLFGYLNSWLARSGGAP